MQMGTQTSLPLFGLLLATLFFLQGVDASTCPNGWMNLQTYCYGVFSKEQEWTAAELDCQNSGNRGHLVSVISENEAEAVSRFIANNHPEVKAVWIGLHDRQKNGRWRWTDSATSMFTAWEGGEPIHVDQSGFCAYLSINQEFQKWNDAFCNSKMPYLCETRL